MKKISFSQLRAHIKSGKTVYVTVKAFDSLCGLDESFMVKVDKDHLFEKLLDNDTTTEHIEVIEIGDDYIYLP